MKGLKGNTVELFFSYSHIMYLTNVKGNMQYLLLYLKYLMIY